MVLEVCATDIFSTLPGSEIAAARSAHEAIETKIPRFRLIWDQIMRLSSDKEVYVRGKGARTTAVQTIEEQRSVSH